MDIHKTGARHCVDWRVKVAFDIAGPLGDAWFESHFHPTRWLAHFRDCTVS